MAELIINDDNYLSHVTPPEGMSTGLILRDWDQMPVGSSAVASQVISNEDLIPREEWPDLIADMERSKSRLSDIAKYYGIRVKNQAQTNFCHANSPALIVEVMRAVAGQPYIALSPAFNANIVTGGRNVGAFILHNLEAASEHGFAPESLVPPNFVGLNFHPQARGEAKKYRIEEWYDFPRNRDGKAFDRMMTCLLRRIPVATAHNWWRHAVSAFDPFYKNGKFGARFRNSWGPSYGEDGWFVMMEGKGTPDEAYAPRVATVSAV